MGLRVLAFFFFFVIDIISFQSGLQKNNGIGFLGVSNEFLTYDQAVVDKCSIVVVHY